MKKLLVLFLGAFIFTGCASYQSKVHKARSLLPASPSVAASQLKEKANKKSPDQLVYLLDYATALQAAGDFEKSSNAFDKAFYLSDQKDYISVSKQIGSVLVTQGLVQYSGKPFEKDLITIMSAINYLSMNRPDKARVEIKRAYDRVNITGSKNSALGFLAGLVWETLGEYDSALISYKEAYESGYRFQDLVGSMKRVAAITGANLSTMGLSVRKTDKSKPSEVIFIYAQGWVPRLRYDLQFRSLPRMVGVFSKAKSASISSGSVFKRTKRFYSVTKSFAENFKKELAGAAAKRTFSYVVKEGAAHTVSKEDKALGQILRVLLHSSDWADLRHWSTLPESLQVARLELEPGQHEVTMRAGGVLRKETISLLPGQKKFIFMRGF